MTEMKPHTLEQCFSLRARIGWQGLRAEEFKEFGPYLVTGTDFKNGKVDWDTCYHVTEDRYAQDKGIQLKEHDLLITKDGTIGKTAVVESCPKKVTLNSGVFVVRATNNEIVPEYLYYVLNSHQFDLFIQNALTGSTIKHLNQEKFYKFTFDAPSVPEQKKIAEVLAELDEVIDKTREIIEKYQNVKKGLLFDTIVQFSDSDYAELSTVADLFNGDRSKNYPTPEEMVSEGAAFINAGHLQNGRVNVEVCDYITQEKFHSLHGAKIKKGDILYCLRGTLGKNAYIDDDLEGTVASSLVVIRAKAINDKFLFYVLNSFIEERQRIAADNGTAQPNLSAKSVSAYKILVPEPERQEEILSYLEAMDEKIHEEEKILRKYQLVKAGLLQDLLSGKVAVTNLM